MTRTARQRSESGVYHVVMRGEGRHLLFENDFDRKDFLDIVEKSAAETSSVILAWCLMGNHVHLLLRTQHESLTLMLRKTAVSYAMRFNLKTEHVGHVFQDRFFSEPVNDDAYLLTVVRYIHNNPQKAKICAYDKYRWSSYAEYLGKNGICDTGLVLNMLGGKRQFQEFSATSDDAICADIDNIRKRLTDTEALEKTKQLFGEHFEGAFASVGRIERDRMLRRLRDAGLSIRQAERITGIGRKPISTAFNKR